MRCCVMRTLITPLAPRQTTDDVMVYIVLNDFGELGRAYVETDEAEADETTIVRKIVNGEYSNPVRVVAFNTAEGWSLDATEEIVRELRERCADEGRVPHTLEAFLER